MTDELPLLDEDRPNDLPFKTFARRQSLNDVNATPNISSLHQSVKENFCSGFHFTKNDTRTKQLNFFLLGFLLIEI